MFLSPGHALHEKKVYRVKKATAHWSAARNEERFPRTAVKPRIQRGFCSPTDLHCISFARALKDVFRMSRVHRLQVIPGHRQKIARLRPSVQNSSSMWATKCCFSCVNLLNPKPGHTTGGSGRGAMRCSGVGPGRAGRRQSNSPRRQASLAPSEASKKRLLKVPPEERSSEIPFKPMEEPNGRLTTGRQSIDKQSNRGTRNGLCSRLLGSGPTPFFVSVNISHTKYIREYILIPKKLFPDMPCMKRVHKDKQASVHSSASKNAENFPPR